MSNQTEIWKPIKGYEGLYEVSNLGRVRSLDRVDSLGRPWTGRVLRPNHNRRHNYLYVHLYRDSRRVGKRVHRLVAEAFLNAPLPDQTDTNHINGDRTDNRLANLEWMTRSENLNHGYWSNLNVSGGPKLNPWIVRVIRRLAGKIEQSQIAEIFGVSVGNVSLIVRGRTWRNIHHPDYSHFLRSSELGVAA